MNLFTLLDQSATRYPNKGAVYLGDTQVLTFAQLHTRVLQIAGYLRRHFAVGDRIVIATANAPEYPELFYGILAAGLTATPVNAKLHPGEIADIIEDSGAVAVFVSAKLANGLRESLAEIPLDCRQIVIASPDYDGLFGDMMREPPPADPEALAWLFYTSGTTGKSKGAMLSHRSLMAATISHLADIENADTDTSLIHSAPMSHGSGLYMTAYLARGARQVIPVSGGFDAAEFVELCNTHPGCAAFFAPTMVQRLRLSVEASGNLPRNLKTVIYGGGPMYIEEIRRSIAVFGPVFTQIYGQGEAPMTITGLRRGDFTDADDALLGSVGYPRSGMQVAVVDDTGKPLPTGEIGEIICRGDIVMTGYWNNPDATRSTLVDGWLYTGDMGMFDARGFLTLQDRSKDVIISGGTNIYPREVEECLLRHPDVEEVSVVGQRDEEWGETVVAFVVLRAGCALDEAALDTHCKAQIARFKRPKRYIRRDELPKSNYGKVLKRELRMLLP